MSFDALANAIFRQEGSLRADGSWNTSSVGYLNNNPGNLTYAGQPGAVPLPSRDPNMAGSGNNVVYARFNTLQDGIAATERQLALDAGRGLTLAQRFSTWSTANRESYIRNVSSWLGVDPNTPLAQLETVGTLPAAGEAAGGDWDGGDGAGAAEVAVSLSGPAIGALVFAGVIAFWLAFD